MADCRGETFAQRGQATCEYVKEQCGYGLCTDSLGEHCYGIDSQLGYRAGQYVSAGNSTCPQTGSYCPMALDIYFIPDVNGFHMCCSKPGLIMSCPQALCSCYELNQLASLTPLPQRSSTLSLAQSSTIATLTDSTITISSTASRSSNGPPVSTSATNSAEHSNNLSKETTAGIAIGVILGAVALFIIAFWLAWVLFRRRKGERRILPPRRTSEGICELHSNPGPYTTNRLHPGGHRNLVQDPPAVSVQEIEGKQIPVEADYRY